MTAERIAAFVAALALTCAAPAAAQDTDAAEAEEDAVTEETAPTAEEAPATPDTDWTVFVDEDPTQCWVVATPRETLNTRDGAEVEVNRGDILVFVSYWPEQNRSGEVSFTGGYPFADGSTVSVTIGDAAFELFTEGEMAWAASEQEDDEIVDAMKRGAEVVMTAQSSRGTRTEDTFSLVGFTAAIEDAEARCTE